MDTFQKVQAQGGAVGGIISCLCGCGCLAASIALVVYLGVYAYNNPDPENCWWVEGATTTTLAVQAGQEDVSVNVHTVFVAWFTWGFWNSIAPCLIAPVVLIFQCLSPKFGMAVGGFLGCANCVSGLVWFIMGCVWRWGAMGTTATEIEFADDITDDKKA